MQIRGHDPLAAFTALSSTTSSWNLSKILQEGNKSNQDLGVNKIRDERGNLPSVQLLQNIDPSLAYQQRVKTLQRNLLEPQLAQQQQVQQQNLQHQRQQQVQQPTQEQGKFNEASHVGNPTGENLDNFSFYSDYFKTLGGKERAQRIIQIQAQKKLDDERRLLQQQQQLQSETFQRLEQERKQKKEELPPILQSLQVDEEVVQQQQTQPIPVIDWKDNIPNQRGSVLSHIVRHFAPANLPKNLLHRRSQEIELNYLISCETLEQYIDPSRLTQYLAECEL